jgi:replicative DNA helicase
MTDTYQYERPFRLKILALLLDTMWMAKYGKTLVVPEYFEMEDEEAVAKAILSYNAAYSRSPSDVDDVMAIAGARYADLIQSVFDLHEEGDLTLASDIVIKFARQQAGKLALLDSLDDINNDNIDAVVARFREVQKVGMDSQSNGIDPIRDISKWLYDYWSDKVRTGLYHVDQILEGGLGIPELGVIIGPPNRGKSMALINLGYGAASIGSGKNVVHFTHEMKIEQVAKRYTARMTFRFPKREDDLGQYEDEAVNVARRFMPGKIRVVGGTKMTFDQIESHLDRLIDDGFDIGMIIDDYPDLMIARRKYKDRRFELSSIYEDWRALAEKYGVPVWCATQSTRSSLNKEIVTMADVAEDIGKAAIADVMIAICQTYEERQMDQARLFMAKLRDSGTKVPLIACKWYPASQAIITTGYVRRKSDKEQDA